MYRAFRSDPNISIRIGSDRGFWPYRKRADRIELFFGGPAIGSDRIGSDRIKFFFFFNILGRIGSDRIGSDRIGSDLIGSDLIGSKHAFTYFGSDRIGICALMEIQIENL